MISNYVDILLHIDVAICILILSFIKKKGPSCSQRKRRRNRSSTSSKQTSAFDYVFQRKSARYRGLFTNLQSSFEEFDPGEPSK